MASKIMVNLCSVVLGLSLGVLVALIYKEDIIRHLDPDRVIGTDSQTQAEDNIYTEQSNVDTSVCPKEREIMHMNPNWVMRRFPGLFLTQEEMDRDIREMNFTYTSRGGVGDHDSDQCCPSRIGYNNQNTRVNINGVTRTIVQFPDASPPVHQFTPVVECIPEEGRCTECSMGNVLYFLLVEDGYRLIFDTFEIAVYCTCIQM